MYVNKKLLNFLIALLFNACKSAHPKTLTISNIFLIKSMTWNIANKLPTICIDYKVTPDQEPTQL